MAKQQHARSQRQRDGNGTNDWAYIWVGVKAVSKYNFVTT